MSNSFATLVAQRQELDRQIAAMQQAAKASAVAEIRALMAQSGVTLADLTGARGAASPARPRSAASGARLAAKYRDRTTGNAWSGRGSRPGWLNAALAAGAKLEDFAV